MDQPRHVVKGPPKAPSLACMPVLCTPPPSTRSIMSEQFAPIGQLVGHGGWITQIATTQQYPDMVLTASRGMSHLLHRNLVAAMNNQLRHG